MKKIIAVLFLASPAFASFYPPVLTPTGVGASTAAIVNGSTGLLILSTNTLNMNTTGFLLVPTGATASTVAVVNGATPLSVLTTGFLLVPAGATASTVAVRNDGTTFNVTTQGGLSNNGVAATTNRVGTLPGVVQNNYNNGTAATQGRDSALSVGTDGLLWATNLPSMRPASYSGSTNTIASAATATDIAAICGNATNTVLVYSLRVSCTQTTAGNVPITILKRSTAYVGVYSTMTTTPQDSNYAVAASSAIFFTANPTVGTLVGHLDNYKLGCMASATASPNDIYISPSDWKMKPIVLRGSGQCLAVNLESTTVTGGSFTLTFNWIETTTITP